MRSFTFKTASCLIGGVGLMAIGTAPVLATPVPAIPAKTTPHLRSSASSGPPTTALTLSATGFGARRKLDIYFGRTHERVVTTNSKGTVSAVRIKVPASALPGDHSITARERHSEQRAKVTFLVNTNWAQYQFSVTRSGFNPYENVLSASNVSRLKLAWSFGTGFGGGADPTMANGLVYAYAGDVLFAVNAVTGAKGWSFNTKGSTIFAPGPPVSGGVVYVGSTYHVHALNAVTGKVLWDHPTANQTDSSPAVVNGVLYTCDGDGSVFALKAATGTRLWSFSGGYIDSSPAVVNRTVYVGGSEVFALNAGTGVPRWSFTAAQNPQSGDNAAFAPTVANGVVYVGDDDFNVYALDARTGHRLWTFPTGDAVRSQPAVANGVVYVGSNDGNLYAINATTGILRWKFQTGTWVIGAPTVANGVVYFSSGSKKIYAFNARTGAKLWSYDTPEPNTSSPVIANGMLYFTTNKLLAFKVG